MTDKFNAIESALQTYLSGDTDIDAQVELFHTKLKPDLAEYGNHELPAIAVHAFAYRPGESKHSPTVTAVVEIVNRGGDLDVVDGKVKTIASLVIDKLRRVDPQAGWEATGLSGIAAAINIEGANIQADETSQGIYTVTGEVMVGVGIVE